MISAVLMAGYENKREVEKYSRTVAEYYGEKYVESAYKPLREFSSLVKGKTVNKPLIQYSLERLFENKLIDEIIIVGHKLLIERRLGNFINGSGKTCLILNQHSPLPDDVVRTFNIIPKKVKQNSIAGNMIKGYAASESCKLKKHALFVASDSPLMTNEFINQFLEFIDRYQSEADIIVPAILIDETEDKLGRLPLRLHNDTPFQFPGRKDEYGRQGFRLSSLLSVNCHRVDINTANTAYSLRKLLNPNIQIKLFKITHGLGYRNVYSKYFLRKDLSISAVEEILSVFFHGRLKVIPMEGSGATYDYDGTYKEYEVISQMLKNREEVADKR